MRQVKTTRIGWTKGHDRHVLMKDLLPVAIRGVLQHNVAKAIVELCAYFKEIGSKVLKRGHLESLRYKLGKHFLIWK